MSALRFNDGKPKVAYILEFPNAIKAVTKVMEFGSNKYEDGNWKKGGKPDSEYLNSMMRHLLSWLQGNTYDDDSECSHLGHAIWNLMALLELNHPDELCGDDFLARCMYWKEKKMEKASNEE